MTEKETVSSWPTYTWEQEKQIWWELCEALPAEGPRYHVVVMQPHYSVRGVFYGLKWYIVDKANKCRIVESTEDCGTAYDGTPYSRCARMNREDQEQCNRLNQIKLHLLSD